MGMQGMILIRLLLMIESVKINGVAFSKSKKLILNHKLIYKIKMKYFV